MLDCSIHTSQLGKSYDGAVYALHDLSIEVHEGEIFGFLGPNGAGKTTTVKLLTGLLKPTEGSCSILGLSPQQKPDEVHRSCGVMTEDAKLYNQMTGMENLLFFAQVSGIPKPVGIERGAELMKRLGIWEVRDKKVRTYSTGMAQRLSLARALVGKPKVLFLDEPTSGLDPESAQDVNRMISDLVREEGCTVFLCTHQLRYAQDLCGNYGILDRGMLLAQGNLASMARSTGLQPKAFFRMAENSAPGSEFHQEGEYWVRDISGDSDMPQLIHSLVNGGFSIYEAKIVKPSLEDVYFQFIHREDSAVGGQER